MKLIRALPDDTLVYCAHEYTESNAAFACVLDKNNDALKKRVAEIAVLRKAAKPTIPAVLGVEKLTNPFLRVDQPDLRKALAKSGIAAEDADAAAVFGLIRSAKDRFGSAEGIR